MECHALTDGAPDPARSPTEADLAALRDGARLFDLQALPKLRLTGPGASDFVQYLSPRNLSGLDVGQSAFTPILTAEGGIADEAVIHRIEEDHYLLVLATGDAWPLLRQAAAGRPLRHLPAPDLHLFALLGAQAPAFLARHAGPDFDRATRRLRPATLFGEEVTIADAGLPGMPGFELFVSVRAADLLRRRILDHGIAAGSEASHAALRIEAGRPQFPRDLPPGTSPWEADLGWAIAPGKKDYMGREGVLRRRGNERFYLCGIEADQDRTGHIPLAGGERIYAFGKEAGVVTSGIYSPHRRRAVGFARLYQFAAGAGTPLVIHGSASVAGRVVPLASPGPAAAGP